MKIEWLFPRIAGQFGESGNMRYLRASLPAAEIVETGLNDRPLFMGETPALIYMGAMSEAARGVVASRLMQYRARLAELIEGGAVMLFTGCSMEVLGRGTDTDSGRQEGLGLLDLSAESRLKNRLNSAFLGEFEEKMPIVGFQSRFSRCDSREKGLFRALRGPGNREGDRFEGARRGNFLGTTLLGPLLPMNPDFTLYLFSLMGAEGARPAFEDAARAAFEKRLAEFKDTKRKLD